MERLLGLPSGERKGETAAASQRRMGSESESGFCAASSSVAPPETDFPAFVPLLLLSFPYPSMHDIVCCAFDSLKSSLCLLREGKNEGKPELKILLDFARKSNGASLWCQMKLSPAV